MIHRGSDKVRSAFYLINTSLPEVGIYARISSRITTVIRVVRYHQINYNWFNEPFAVSQYKQFILRHAWLNLWDKHMTTGRINQVAIVRWVRLRHRRITKTRRSAEKRRLWHPLLQANRSFFLDWSDFCSTISDSQSSTKKSKEIKRRKTRSEASPGFQLIIVFLSIYEPRSVSFDHRIQFYS